MEQVLVRTVARAFYRPDEQIIMDALVNHSALSMEEFREIHRNSGRQSKEIAKALGSLREGGLVSVYVRQETKANAQKATTVEYFYIDYRRAIDATKYRLHMLQEQLQMYARPTTEKKEFVCPKCTASYTQMDALDNPDPLGRGSGFLCKRCGNLLTYAPPSKEDDIDADNPLSRFNKQFEFLVHLLDAIDKTIVPAVTGESALENAKPVPRDKGPLPGSAGPSDGPKARPTAVMGVRTDPEKVHITLTTEEETEAAVQAAEAERKARIGLQNQLPAWHTQSTVGDDAAAAAAALLRGGEASGDWGEAGGGTTPGGSGGEEKPLEDDDDIVDFFKVMVEEQRLAALKRQEEEDEEDESDEEEFEDVQVEASEQPEAKRLKAAEESSVESPSVKVETPVEMKDVNEESDEDDEEFETVV
jgi:transcription initiation factor TFIIE subunit alpha